MFSMALWMLFLLYCQLARTELRCSSNQISCKSGTKCVSHGYVCDGSYHCPDRSDEDPAICTFWKNDDHRCSRGNIYCPISYGCKSFSQACQDFRCSNYVPTKICELIKKGKLELEDEKPTETSIALNDEFVGILQMAVNATSRQGPCPMLYSKVGNMCLAFFSPAKIPWPEARQFCLSIMGDLLDIADFNDSGELLQYMRMSELTTDYWIGGRFDLDTNSWSWVADDKPMPLGSPFWATRYSSSCVPRSPPQTDPFSNPPAALPRAPCFNYVQAPAKRSQGWCAALTYEHYYYISDEECQENRSPLCIYVVNSPGKVHQKPANNTES